MDEIEVLHTNLAEKCLFCSKAALGMKWCALCKRKQGEIQELVWYVEEAGVAHMMGKLAVILYLPTLTLVSNANVKGRALSIASCPFSLNWTLGHVVCLS